MFLNTEHFPKPHGFYPCSGANICLGLVSTVSMVPNALWGILGSGFTVLNQVENKISEGLIL